MSLFGALFTGVSTLTSQAQSMAMISNNIANVSTVGYKRVNADFKSVVTQNSGSTVYTPGSVFVVQKNNINQQGAITQTNSTTDMSISGNGFFVTRASLESGNEPIYTRAGSFVEDSQGYLRNSAGFYLFGWPLDAAGNIPVASADISSTVPVQVSFAGGLTRPTSIAEIALNLNAEETPNAYPLTGAEPTDFTRGIRFYDSLGEAQDVIINFRKLETPSAQANGTVDLSATSDLTTLGGFAAGDQFSITIGANPAVNITINAGDDVNDLVANINATLVGGTAYVNDDGELNIVAINNGDTLTLADVGAGTILSSGALGIGAGANASPVAPTLMTPLAGAANPFGWWDMEILAPNGSTLSRGAVNFNGNGTINGVVGADGEVSIPLTAINWGNGSDPQDVDFQVTNFTQFAGEYNVVYTTQNGAELGLRTGITVDDEGYVVANFSNGQSTRIYQIPLATFANPNGLDEVTGNGYIQTDRSGDFNLRVPGDGGSGLVQGATVEASNVDLADEFSKMIITQRAYSAGTKVISTADQMTEELLRLR